MEMYILMIHQSIQIMKIFIMIMKKTLMIWMRQKIITMRMVENGRELVKQYNKTTSYAGGSDYVIYMKCTRIIS